MRRRLGGLLRTVDGTLTPTAATVRPAAPPRLVEAPPRPGFHYPARRADVARLLGRLTADALYGLRRVELCRGPAWLPGGRLCFGRLFAPGRIQLFDLPRPPWRLLGSIPADPAAAFARAGAIVTTDRAAGTTIVEWPDDSLASFVLVDVLLHELGHHVLQHGKGKRLARIARTRDHEAFAARFAERYRAIWRERSPPA